MLKKLMSLLLSLLLCLLLPGQARAAGPDPAGPPVVEESLCREEQPEEPEEPVAPMAEVPVKDDAHHT